MKLLFCGDFIVYGDDKDIDRNTFGEFSKVIKEADIAIYNQEFPVTTCKEVYETKKFALTATTLPSQIKPLANVGFNYATTATNHIFNRGINGLKDTHNILKSHDIIAIGSGKSLSEAKKIEYVEQNGVIISLLNFAIREYNTATDNHGGANPYDIADIVTSIQEAKAKSDYIFLIIHGGIDFCRYPSPRMVKEFRFFAEQGASAIIAHHSHVVSGYEIYKDVPIFYGIGNFIPGYQIVDESKYSMPVEFIIDNNKLSYVLYKLKFSNSEKKLEYLKGDELQEFNNKIDEVSNDLGDIKKLKLKIKDNFLNIEKEAYYISMFTRSNYFLFKLFRKIGLLNIYSYYMKFKLKMNLKNTNSWNLLRCQTHNDILDLIYESNVDVYKN